VWHEPVDIPTSSATSQLAISMGNVFYLGIEVGQAHCSSSIEVLSFFKHLNHS
jgi:hypothetical protein